MDGTVNSTCRRNCWLLGMVAGLLVAVMMAVVAQYGVLIALALGAAACLLLGLFLTWAFCSGDVVAAEAEATQVVSRPAPAPEPMRAASMPDAIPAPVPTANKPPSAGAGTAAAAVPKAPGKPEAVAGPKPAKAAARATKAATRTTVATPAKRAVTGSALDAALAKSREPASTAGPELLTGPRGGTADNLKQIRGVGPKLEALLNDVGVWHFDQIASWKAKDIAFVDAKMEGFKGRISRDEWVKQAKVLARGGTTEFSERFVKGAEY